MTKQVTKTAEIISMIRASLDNEDVDVSNFSVFEAKMLSTEAISQKGFYDGAKISRSTLVEMAEFVNTSGTVVPLLTMHETRMLPVGRVFGAEVKDINDGESHLNGLFYIANTDETETTLVKKIEASTIDEVSVGFLAKRAMCSECGFDYFGEEADFMNIFSMTCDEDHTVGVDGVHVRLVGMDTFAELSLVGRGAAKDAKILSRAKQTLSEESVKRLAANGIPIEAHLLTANYKLDSINNNHKGDYDMPNGLDLTAFAETNQKLGQATVELSQANEKLVGLNSEIEGLKASLIEKDKLIEELKAAEATSVTEVKAELSELKTKFTDLKDFVSADLKAALVATGDAESEVSDDLMTNLALIKEKGVKLHQLFGAGNGGVANSGTKVPELSAAEVKRMRNFKVN